MKIKIDKKLPKNLFILVENQKKSGFVYTYELTKIKPNFRKKTVSKIVFNSSYSPNLIFLTEKKIKIIKLILGTETFGDF